MVTLRISNRKRKFSGEEDREPAARALPGFELNGRIRNEAPIDKMTPSAETGFRISEWDLVARQQTCAGVSA